MSNTPTASSNAIQFSKYVNKSDLKGLPKIDVIKLITLIAELSSCANEIRNAIMDNDEQVFYWKRNYGFSLTNLVIENIGYSDKTTKMLDLAYASKMQFERTQETINIRQRASMSFNNQVDAVLQLEKLKKMGILTESEFQKKKKEILGL